MKESCRVSGVYHIKQCIFDNVVSRSTGGIITNIGQSCVILEYSKFTGVCSSYNCSSCSGVIYKNNGSVLLNNNCFDFCWTIFSGNNAVDTSLPATIHRLIYRTARVLILRLFPLEIVLILLFFCSTQRKR